MSDLSPNHAFNQDFEPRDVVELKAEPRGYHQISIPAHYNRGLMSCIQHENILINDMAKQITAPRRRSQIWSGGVSQNKKGYILLGVYVNNAPNLISELWAWVRHPSSEIWWLESGIRWGSNGEIQVRRRSRGTIVRCLYSSAAGHTKMRVRRIPITEN